jgi:hypothetical protein
LVDYHSGPEPFDVFMLIAFWPLESDIRTKKELEQMLQTLNIQLDFARSIDFDHC